MYTFAKAKYYSLKYILTNVIHQPSAEYLRILCSE